MSKVLGVLKAAFTVAYLGAAIGAVVSYVHRDWQWHLENFDALLSPQARPFYLRMVWNYVGLAFMLSVPVALLFSLLLGSLSGWLATRHRVAPSVFGITFGAVSGAAAGVILHAVFGGSGAPVLSGIVGGGTAGLVLARPLQRWLLSAHRPLAP